MVPPKPCLPGRQVMGRPFAAPPEVRKDRVDALRNAFTETMADKEFLAEAEKAKLEITPYQARRSRASCWKFIATRPRNWRRRREMR